MFDSRFEENDFYDASHLSEKCAEKISKIVQKEVVDKDLHDNQIHAFSSAVVVIKNKKMRVQYIDAMRGFAIILVVLGHVLGQTFHLDGGGLLGWIIYSFHMPLFFFISGYVAYSEKTLVLRQEITKKFLCLVLPAFIFYSIYIIVNDVTYDAIINRGGGGHF